MTGEADDGARGTAAADAGARLVVDGLSARGRGGLALGPLSFTVQPGAPLAVLGGPGAGKSLLLAALAGLCGSEGALATPAGRVAMVFQRDALDDAKTALGNVAVVAEREAAREALARVGLGTDADKLPRQLSGGMKKRVGIARALAVAPALLLADDPTAGLDPDTAAEVLALLLEGERERCVVIATQDVDVVLPRCAQALVLEEGKPVFLGTPAALAADARTAAFAPVEASP